MAHGGEGRRKPASGGPGRVGALQGGEVARQERWSVRLGAGGPTASPSHSEREAAYGTARPSRVRLHACGRTQRTEGSGLFSLIPPALFGHGLTGGAHGYPEDRAHGPGRWAGAD